MDTFSFLPFAAAVTALATGCMAGTGGELSNGAFIYDCSNTTDAACAGTFTTTIPASGVAVGSHFKINYQGEHPETEDGVSFSVSVVPASPAMVEVDSTGFRAKLPGQMAFLGRGTNGVVADFVHVRAAAIDRVEVSESGLPQQSVTLAVGQQVTLSAAPKDVTGQTLGGALAYDWLDSAPSIATLDAQSGNVVTLYGAAAGSGNLTVTAGEASSTIGFTVEAL